MITKYTIRQYVDTKLSHLQPKSIIRKTATIKAFLETYVDDDYLVVNPVKKAKLNIKIPKPLPRNVPVCNIRKVLFAAYKELEYIEEVNELSYSHMRALQQVLILEIMYLTGMRIFEVCGLKTRDIDLETGTIRIWGKGSKEREAMITDDKVLVIMRYYHESFVHDVEDFFINRLGNPISPQSVRGMIGNLCKKLGITYFTPHQVRHTFATEMIAGGASTRIVQKSLGHSSVLTTERYTYVSNETLKKALMEYHPRKKEQNLPVLKMPTKPQRWEKPKKADKIKIQEKIEKEKWLENSEPRKREEWEDEYDHVMREGFDDIEEMLLDDSLEKDIEEEGWENVIEQLLQECEEIEGQDLGTLEVYDKPILPFNSTFKRYRKSKKAYRPPIGAKRERKETASNETRERVSEYLQYVISVVTERPGLSMDEYHQLLIKTELDANDERTKMIFYLADQANIIRYHEGKYYPAEPNQKGNPAVCKLLTGGNNE